MQNTFRLSLILAGFTIITGASMTYAYEVGEVQQGGTIQGQITFLGPPPVPSRFTVEKNPEVCGQERSLIKVDALNGFLMGAVVVLDGVEKGKPFPAHTVSGTAPGEGVFRYQGGKSLGMQVKTKECNFGPFTSVVESDQPVQFGNLDSIKHTLHTFAALDDKGSVLRTIHNRDIHPDHEIHRTFSSAKLRGSRVVRIACNRHDFMQNWLYVVENPYFSLSDQDGRFQIDEIPPGNYTLRVWHPILGLQEKAVEVGATQTQAAHFTFSE